MFKSETRAKPGNQSSTGSAQSGKSADTSDKVKAADVTQSVISEAITITGDVSSRDQLIVNGTINGDMDCTSLVVGQDGNIKGHILADEVIVHGQVEGSIRSMSVSLHKTARISGDIFHQNIAIEMGTVFDGSLRRSEDPKSEGTTRTLEDNSSGIAAGSKTKRAASAA